MKPGFLLLLLFFITSVRSFAQKAEPREYYRLTVYHFKDAGQEKVIDDYLKNALLPAMHRAGINKVGVFKPLSNDTAADKLLYIFEALKTPEAIVSLDKKLAADKDYMTAGSSYLEADYKNAPFARKESILLYAFSLAPKMELPKLTSSVNDKIYELRSYESATEKIHLNKVQMFNEGDEVGLFKRLGFNAIFYAQVIAGSKMPNLMYMTSFENMQQRDAHWKAFVDDPQWKKLVAMPEYQNNVSHMDIILMKATPYSDF